MSGFFLVKSDPETYSFHDLERDGKTVWDGVKNPTALRHIKSVTKGDQVLVYHSGDEKSVVGLAKAASAAYADPKDKSGKLWVFDIQFVKNAKSPVTLKTIKADPVCKGMDLVRISRLSTMAVTEKEFDHICELAGL